MTQRKFPAKTPPLRLSVDEDAEASPGSPDCASTIEFWSAIDFDFFLGFTPAGYFRAASRPEPICRNSGWTLTTPNCRPSTSLCAAMAQRKAIRCPGTETLG